METKLQVYRYMYHMKDNSRCRSPFHTTRPLPCHILKEKRKQCNSRSTCMYIHVQYMSIHAFKMYNVHVHDSTNVCCSGSKVTLSTLLPSVLF